MSELKKLCKGLQPLSKAFWGYYVVGGIVVFVIFSVIGGLVIYATASTFPVVRPIVYIIGCFIIWAYWVTSSVGVWRSANATKAGSLRIVAKIVVALFAATQVLMLISGNFVTIIMKELSN